MKLSFVNDWSSRFHYGGAIIMISWLKLESYKSFSFVVLGIGFSLTKGEL